MTGLSITCGSCHRSWKLAVDASPYLMLDLAGRPCPCCEAGTLNCLEPEEATPPPRRSVTGSEFRSRAKRKETHGHRQMDP